MTITLYIKFVFSCMRCLGLLCTLVGFLVIVIIFAEISFISMIIFTCFIGKISVFKHIYLIFTLLIVIFYGLAYFAIYFVIYFAMYL